MSDRVSWRNFLFCIGYKKLLFLSGLLIVIVFSAKSNLAYLTLRNAVGGFSPVDYIQIISNPEISETRFPNGVENLTNSLIFHVYEAASKIGINPEDCQRIVIVVSVIFFAFSLLFFSYTLLPRSPILVHFLTVLFGLATDVLNHDLSRFETVNSLSLGQMYGYATACALIAIAFAFKSQWIKCWPMIGVTFTLHPAIAVYTTVVCSAITITNIHQLANKKFWTGWILGVLIAFFWMFFVISPSMSGYPLMSSEIWVNWSRFANYHWYPFSLPVFKQEHFRRITPLLSLMILAFTRLRMISEVSWETKKIWIASLISLVLLTVLGLFATLYSNNPNIIKISLHRSSVFILIICLPLSLDLLVRDLMSSSLFRVFIGCLLLITPLIGVWGFPLFFSILRYEIEFFHSSFALFKERYIDFLAQGIVTLALIMVSFLLANSFAIWNHPAFISKISIIIFSIIFAVIVLFFQKFSLLFVSLRTLINVVLIVFCVLWGIFSMIKVGTKLLPWGNLEKATDYYKAQLWAKENSKPGSLFMVDPDINYGWEAYSQRPKYGSFRDLVHAGWAYTGNSLVFNEGLRRIRLLGVEPSEYLLRSLQNRKLSVGPEYSECAKEVQKAFYLLDDTAFKSLSKKEGIDFFVAEKQQMINAQMHVVYENAHFCIYTP